MYSTKTNVYLNLFFESFLLTQYFTVEIFGMNENIVSSIFCMLKAYFPSKLRINDDFFYSHSHMRRLTQLKLTERHFLSEFHRRLCFKLKSTSLSAPS